MARQEFINLEHVGEFGLINRIAGIFGGQKQPGLIQGIGDDAAVVKIGHGLAMIFTTDMLIEDVHFSLEYEDFFDIGWKSLAVNLSDIASMGGRPKWGVVSVGLPVNIPVDNVDKLAQGIASLARKYQVAIVGGDTVKSPDRLVINIALLGESAQKDVLYRRGAVAGDALFVTGKLGEAAAGLEALKTGRQISKLLLKRYRRPEPRIKESALLVKHKLASSMIDVSDGLSLSVKFICQQSKTGAKIYLDKIPLNRQLASNNYQQALHWALNGGEDYELLFTVPPPKIKKALGFFPKGLIGEIVPGKKITLLDQNNQEVNFKNSGYDHFKK